MNKMLTKSILTNQCQRKLWFQANKQLPKPSISDTHKSNQGYEFQKQVYKLFPEENSILLSNCSTEQNLIRTNDSLKSNKILFEAGFQHDNVYVRTDILIPNNNGYDLVEIKATNDKKPEHIPDLAIQLFILQKNNIQINKIFINHLNKEYIKHGAINPKELVKITEVTEEVKNYELKNTPIQNLIDQAKQTLELTNPPEIIMGSYCSDCPLKEDCKKQHLPEHSVLELTNWRQYWQFYNDGILDMKDIPQNITLHKKDEIIRDATLNNKPFISKEHIKHFLKSLNYPLYHFDFETFDLAVPKFDQSRPWQKIPFQYSLHIEQEDGTTEHREFLSDGDEDPRIKLLKQMKTDLQGTGDIITYNKSFEISVMKNLAEDFPEHSEWLLQAINRVVDLADIFRAFYYYDKSQKGSYSIKKVLPAITGKSYSELEIGNGGDASMLFFYSHINKELTNKEEIRANLLKYCGLDTEGMVWILKELKLLI